MKKQILAALFAGACAAMASANVTSTPGDRIDAYTSPDSFKSILVDDIISITYLGDPATGYTHAVIKTNNGTVNLPLDGLHQLIYKSIDGKAHEISTVNTENSAFRMLYNFNDPDSNNPVDPDMPYGWRGGQAGDPVLYLLAPGKGYTCDYTVKGLYSGYDYYPGIRGFVTEISSDITAQFGLGVDCLMFTMPYEPVVMTLTETERNDYAGLPFLGTYHGGRLSTLGKGLRTSTSEELTYEIKANATFIIKATEVEDGIDLLDAYTYDSETGQFVNVQDPDDVNQSPQYLKVKWGVSGSFSPENVLFLTARYLPDAVGSNNRHFFALPENSSFTIADGDDYAMRQLLEIRPENGTPIYYYIGSYGYDRKHASVEFAQGTTIAEPCVAYITYNGERQAKYTLTDASSKPVITLKGAEAGTYRYTGTGTHTDMELDGFGTATIDGTECSYTISSGLVTLSLPTGEVVMMIDAAAGTYAEKVDAKWEGAKMFSTSKAVGSYAGEEEQANCTVTLLLDQNYNGTANPGNAVVKISVPRSDYYQPLEIQGSGAEYVYDPDARTITVSNLKTYMWTGSEWKYGGYNLTFHLSDDLKSMWIGTEGIGEKFWGTKKDGSYILTGEQCVLYADGEEPSEPAPALDITGTYTGTVTGSLYGSSKDLETTLTIGEETARLQIQVFGSDVINSEVSYTFEDNTLTLKGVTVGNGDGYSGQTTTEDIVLNYNDGTWTSSGTYYGTTTMTAGMEMDFSTLTLSK